MTSSEVGLKMEKLLILAFALILYGGCSASPVLSKLESFALDIVEKGTFLTQTVDIYKDDGIEVYHTPKHNDLDEMIFIFDFNKNKTLRVFPGRKMCFLGPMPPAILPDKTDNSLNVAKGRGRFELLADIKADYVVSETPVTDRHLLHPIMQEACAPYSMFEAEPLPEIVSVRAVGGMTTLPPPTYVQNATQGKSREIRSACSLADTAQKCKKGGSGCIYYVVCSVYMEIPQCVKHLTSSDYTCRPCCNKIAPPQHYCPTYNF